jgi:hypothetical protein
VEVCASFEDIVAGWLWGGGSLLLEGEVVRISEGKEELFALFADYLGWWFAICGDRVLVKLKFQSWVL